MLDQGDGGYKGKKDLCNCWRWENHENSIKDGSMGSDIGMEQALPCLDFAGVHE